jgi:hypothetical protein
MKNFKYIVFAGLSMFTYLAQAQYSSYVDDALIIGQSNAITGSTARMQGLAGTQVSLGADMSSAGSNPAGLGMYNRSVVSFTPSLNFNTADATYNGSLLSNYKNNFNFANLGIVLNSGGERFKDEDFKGGSFAITLQRSYSYNQTFSYAGRNYNNSITDAFIEEAIYNESNGFGQIGDDELIYPSDYAFEQFLIERADTYEFTEYDDGAVEIYPRGDYDSFTSLAGATSPGTFTPVQSELVKRYGDNYALNFSWGGNYKDRVYFGAGLAYKNVDYTQERYFEESSFESSTGVSDDLVQRIRFDDTERVSGKGIDFTGGVIVRPTNFMTVGLSYASPTFYSLDREYEYRLRTDLATNYYYYNESSGTDSTFFDLGSFDTRSYGQSDAPPLFTDSYNLKTAPRLTLGTSVFVGKNGFISGDVEFVDYQAMKVKSNDVIADGDDNSSISSVYNSVINYRLGAEYRIENIRLRAGYAFYADPYSSSSIDVTQKALTFGVGYRSQDFFADVALVNQSQNEVYTPYYVTSNQPVVNVDHKKVTISATLGFNF